jgi:predicted secreted hydrolase
MRAGHARGAGTRAGTQIALLVAIASAVALAGCGGEPILANPAIVLPAPPTPQPSPTPIADPIPVELPRDDGPHDRLTEWWYYTGHLVATDGRHFGFEAVIFRAERGSVPVTWASHLALTDEAGKRFLYGQRSEVGGAADRSPIDASGAPSGFDLAVTGFDPTDPTSATRAPWRLAGSGGHDRIVAALSPAEAAKAGAAFGLDLRLDAEKPAALHDHDGWIDFGPAGGSYYYSRIRMAAGGTLTIDGAELAVTGTAWFDHQWGDFISVGGGGWDWFAVNLDDGTDLTLSLVRNADGTYPLVYGTIVDADGKTTHLDRSEFEVTSKGTWVSPATGAVYPAGWLISIPSRGLFITLAPTVQDQELDTRATTGVVYWEGSQTVTAVRGRFGVSGGEAYVELTGYAPAGP